LQKKYDELISNPKWVRQGDLTDETHSADGPVQKFHIAGVQKKGAKGAL